MTINDSWYYQSQVRFISFFTVGFVFLGSFMVVVVVVVTLFPTKIHENTHMYNTLTVVSPQNVRMYFVSGCQKKLRLIELAAAYIEHHLTP